MLGPAGARGAGVQGCRGKKRACLLALRSPKGLNPGGNARLTLPSTATLLSQPPLELGLRGPRPALPNLLGTPGSRLLCLAQTEGACVS